MNNEIFTLYMSYYYRQTQKISSSYHTFATIFLLHFGMKTTRCYVFEAFVVLFVFSLNEDLENQTGFVSAVSNSLSQNTYYVC